jgi:hypothetical protein
MGYSVLKTGHFEPIWSNETVHPSTQVDDQTALDGPVRVDFEGHAQRVRAPRRALALHNLAVLQQSSDLRPHKIHFVPGALIVLLPIPGNPLGRRHSYGNLVPVL